MVYSHLHLLIGLAVGSIFHPTTKLQVDANPSPAGPDQQYIILARHGQTTAQNHQIVQGWTETNHTGLTAQGHEDMARLAQTIGECFDNVHEIRECGQKRTHQSGKHVQYRFPEAVITKDPDLRGLGFGKLEGKTYHQAGIGSNSMSITDQSWRQSIAERERGQIEAHSQFRQRAKNSLARMIAKDPAGHCPSGQPYCTFVAGHDWTVRTQLAELADKEGVHDRSGKWTVEGPHGSGEYSLLHVNNIHAMPVMPGTNTVDLDKAPGNHFTILGKMLHPGEKPSKL